MKTAILAIAALALTAGLAAAQVETSQPQGQSDASAPDHVQDRRDKSRPIQSIEGGAPGASVGTDQPATVKAAPPMTETDKPIPDRAARGTGVATGFVAAGIGLAILGLFVRRKSRREDHDDKGGSGTQTRL